MSKENRSPSKGYFDDTTALIRLEIDISPKSYKGIFREFHDDVYHPATVLLSNGDSMSVKMRVRGDSSRDRDKKSLKLKHGKDEYLLTRSNKVNLNAESLDPTYLRQYLASLIYNQSGQPAYRTRHVELYINHEFQGVYLWIESMDKHFLERAELNPKGNLYKATFDGATLSAHDDLYKNWEKKTNKKNPKIDDLVKLRNEINSVSDEDYFEWVKKTFDYDNLVNALAVNMLISNSSTYYHNYYLYHDLEKNKWYYLPWDMDDTFKKNYTDMHYQRGSWAERKSAKMEGNPLHERSIINSKILGDIQKRITEIYNNSCNIERLGPVIDSLVNQLEPLVENEKNVSQETSFYREEVNEVKNFIMMRYEDLQQQFKHNPTSFSIEQPTEAFTGDVILKWSPSIDPDKDELRYEVTFCKDESFNFGVQEITNISGNQVVIPRNDLSPGKYYFMVSVSDGNEQIYGYHCKHSFWVVKK